MDEIVREFLVESYENLDRLDQDLIALEKDADSKETIGSIFRTLHTLKGASGFLGFGRLEAVAHVAENLLSKLREGSLTLTPSITTALLSTVDAVRGMLEQIEQTGGPGEKDHSVLIQELTRLGGESALALSLPPVPLPPLTIEEALLADSAPEPLPPPVPPLILPKSSAAEEESGSGDGAESRSSAISDSTIRVDVGLLDKLMNLVGELVLARNQILQFSSQSADGAFLATSQRLNLITTELQGHVMKTRMQPIGNVWNKLPRVVRDLAASCGKEVRIEMEGQETELDKTIIEAIKDPLTHIVRNSVDHGIETPDARENAGKPREGLLKMRAYHEGGQVNIEITDDGAGIDAARIKQKALERALLRPEQIARLSPHDALQLIFLPGFSTAEKITNVSGRGVGMDVVKTNIEKIGGTVDLQTDLGEGTTLRIKIPLTLAIIPALIVSASGDRFAIPQVSLLELVRLEPDEARTQIEFIHGTPVYRLRGKLLPLAYLDRELGVAPAVPQRADGAVNIVVLQADRSPFGLVVDDISDSEEIVVKPLGKQLKGVSAFAGATIMEDGTVALILDVLGIAQKAGVVNAARERALADSTASGRKGFDNRQTLLLFDAGQGSRMAIPLSMVARLEEFPPEMVEYSGAQEVVNYRGQILPLVRVAKHIPALRDDGPPANGPMQVIVYSENGRSVGLVVGEIRDVVQESITVKRHACSHGIFGSVLIQDQVTDLLDVKSLIRAADPSFYGAGPGAAPELAA